MRDFPNAHDDIFYLRVLTVLSWAVISQCSHDNESLQNYETITTYVKVKVTALLTADSGNGSELEIIAFSCVRVIQYTIRNR